MKHSSGSQWPPELMSRMITFDELLHKLRFLHEEICTHSVRLELRVKRVTDSGVPREDGQVDTNCLQLAGVATSDRPRAPLSPGTPSRTPCITPPLLCTPRVGSSSQPLRVTSTSQPRSRSVTYSTQNSTTSVIDHTFEAEHSNDLALSEDFRGDFVIGAQASRHNESMRSDVVASASHRHSSIRSVRSSRQSLRSDVSQPSLNRFAVASGNTLTTDSDESRTKEFTRVQSHIGNCQRKIRNIVNSTSFSALSSLVMLSHAIFIAIDTEMLAKDPQREELLTIEVMHYVFNSIFFVEWVSRFAADGRSALFGNDSFWNWLDTFFVIVWMAELIVDVFAAEKGGAAKAGSVVRTVRIARVFRTVRILRAFRQFHEFQKMAYALISSLRTLICSLTLLIFVMFVFAVGLTQGAATEVDRIQIVDLHLRYGSLGSTMYTLFLSISNGISWDSAYMPLHELSWVSAVAFIIYVSIGSFGVLNVITSIFVESVIRSVQHYKDLIIKDKEIEKKIAVTHMKEVFYQLDSDASGEVSADELEYFMSEPSLRKYMEALDLEAEDTRLLFRLLDRDGSRCINVEEFCDGCMRLKGTAKSMDVNALIFQTKNFLTKWGEFTFFVEESFTMLRRQLARDSLDIFPSYPNLRTSTGGLSEELENRYRCSVLLS